MAKLEINCSVQLINNGLMQQHKGQIYSTSNLCVLVLIRQLIIIRRTWSESDMSLTMTINFVSNMRCLGIVF